MADAFNLAGFEVSGTAGQAWDVTRPQAVCPLDTSSSYQVWDVTMQDLCSGAIGLDTFRGVAFVGGFSYADVLGSGKGECRLLLSPTTHILEEGPDCLSGELGTAQVRAE